MLELTPKQMESLERLFIAGFRPIAIPPYEKALCLHRGECVAILAPIENGTFKLLAPPTLLVSGNLSVRLKKGAAEVFVWRKNQLPATTERLESLALFRTEMEEILELTRQQ